MKYQMAGIKRIILYYDIMCQFWTNLKKRFKNNPHIDLPPKLEILRAIGLFHVHGHKDECFARFAPTFIPGAGQVDGEILETLWAVLNGIATSTRRQSIAYRTETMDDHMNDSNYKKLIGMSKSSTFPVKHELTCIQLSVSAKNIQKQGKQKPTLRTISKGSPRQHRRTICRPGRSRRPMLIEKGIRIHLQWIYMTLRSREVSSLLRLENDRYWSLTLLMKDRARLNFSCSCRREKTSPKV